MDELTLYQRPDGTHIKAQSALERSDLGCKVNVQDGESPAGLDYDLAGLAALAGEFLPGEWSGVEPCRIGGQAEGIRFTLRYYPAWREGEPVIVGIHAGAHRNTSTVASIDLAGTIVESRQGLRTSVRESARQLRGRTREEARERARRWSVIADSLD